MWDVVAIAVVSAVAAAEQQRQAANGAYEPPKREKALDQIVREHQARVSAETRATLGQAKVGMFLLVALVVAIGASIYQWVT